MTEAHTPHYANVVLVPVALPDTAVHMLELATSLAEPENGRVIAVTVSTGPNEESSKARKALDPIVDSYVERGHRVELITQIASSVTRGILDASRDYEADMIILGVERAARRQVRLGSIAENVMEAAACDVLIYRMGESPSYDRVVVPVDGSPPCRVALNTAVMIAQAHQAHLMPLYIQRNYVYNPQSEREIREALSLLDDEAIEREIITGTQPARQILTDLGEDDLLVLGFSHRSDFEHQIGSDLASDLLNRATGPVLLASRVLPDQVSLIDQMRRRLSRFNPTLTDAERQELIWHAQKNALLNVDYLMSIVFSAGLATLGLMLNSVAVIIGAMLVAPLMTPLASFSIGLTSGALPITQRSLLTLVQGVLLALLLAIAMGLLLPLDVPTSEMLARGNPSLLDAGVALFSGCVAAYATARKDIPAALAGVAIAAALMPPVCTIGLGIALADPALAGGASLLFVTNIIFIIMGASFVFLWLGMRHDVPVEGQIGAGLWWVGLVASFVALLALLVGLNQRAVDALELERFLTAQFHNAQLIDVQMDEAEPLRVLVMLRSEQLISGQDAATVEDLLAMRLGRAVQLELSVEQLIRPQRPVAAPLPEATPETESGD